MEEKKIHKKKEQQQKQQKMKINVDKSGKFMNLNNDIIIWHGRQQTTVAIVVVDTVADRKTYTGWFLERK